MPNINLILELKGKRFLGKVISRLPVLHSTIGISLPKYWFLMNLLTDQSITASKSRTTSISNLLYSLCECLYICILKKVTKLLHMYVSTHAC